MDNILKNPALFIWNHTICTENTQREARCYISLNSMHVLNENSSIF